MNKEIGIFNSYTLLRYFMLCMQVGTTQQKNYLRKYVGGWNYLD